jgi:hypothetical protein
MTPHDEPLPGAEGCSARKGTSAPPSVDRDGPAFPSRALLVGDFVEKTGPSVASPFARGVAHIFGVSSHPMASPEFRYYTTDAEAFRKSVADVLQWPIERVFLCHGELIEEKGREIVAQVVDSLLEEVRGRSSMSRA